MDSSKNFSLSASNAGHIHNFYHSGKYDYHQGWTVPLLFTPINRDSASLIQKLPQYPKQQHPQIHTLMFTWHRLLYCYTRHNESRVPVSPLATAGKVSAAEVTNRKCDNFGSMDDIFLKVVSRCPQ